ncbi:MAG TPA: SDR family NAD(P)-dependent oxidoreductase [Candidatus Margulisiibacteriota bacterium]|nr:SDR family NAD(P)-dependent oxidoreductase [Candidatus Margulisiibacteriota bacterium]
MREFRDKVAVVTGAASGIGQALAQRFAREGMRVVLADVEAAALERAAGAIDSSGTRALPVRTDVSKAADVERLAQVAQDKFGAIHIVCNNAGVVTSGPTWMQTVADWEWLLGVNLWGVIHGVRVFTPILLAQGEGHIVNTASLAGMITGPGAAPYNVSKFAVVALSETLHHELTMLGSAVRVSVLCPGFVNTNIADAARNRPAALSDTAPQLPGSEEMAQMGRRLLANGSPPSMVADVVFEAIRNERFYIFPHPEWKRYIRARMEDILEERVPTLGTMDEVLELLKKG